MQAMVRNVLDPLARSLACAFVLSAGGAAGFGAAAGCDRACLKSTLDQYLNAVVKHNPEAAPLFIGFRQTENAVVVKLGTGVWKTVTGLGKVQRRYLDPVSGQAGYFGTMEEDGGTAIVTVRVKVEQRKITEAEWYIARRGDPGLNGPPANGRGGGLFDPDNLAATAPAERTLPREARLPREAMMGITNSYFDGITTHDGSIIMAHPGCMRVENGVTVTGRGGRGRGAAVPGGPTGLSDCTSNLATINIEMVVARRYPIVDEEAGVVLALAVFQRKPGTPTRRNTFSEWFVLDGNRIRSIYSAMFYPPPEAPVPNWPPYGGNWPLPASLAAPARGQ
jgi:hypothetical protein